MARDANDEKLGNLTRRFVDLVRRIGDGSVSVDVALNYVQRAIDSGKSDAPETVVFGTVLTPELLAVPVVKFGKLYYRHPNGGGWVAETSEVADSVYVGFEAVVSGDSKLTGSVNIQGGAEVADSDLNGDIEVTCYATVRHMRIRGQAKIMGKVAYATFVGKSFVGMGEIVEHGHHENVTLGTPPDPDDPFFH